MRLKPANTKTNKWTVKELNAIPTDWIGNILADGEGLSGKVLNSLKVSFTYQYNLKGKMIRSYCGTYPNTDLADIRKERDRVRELVGRGIDPREEKEAANKKAQQEIADIIKAEEVKKAENLTFGDMFTQWINDGVKRGDDNQYIKQSFGKHAIPTLGNIPIRDLTEHHLRDLYRGIIDTGKIATAVELSKDIGQMIRWADIRQPWRRLLIECNPAALVDINLLTPIGYQKNRTRTLSPSAIYQLSEIFKNQEITYSQAENRRIIERPLKKESQLALWICLATSCRVGELSTAEWAHVDFTARTWFKPAENTKGREGKRREHLVYLSDFSLDKFKQLHALTGSQKWLFPATLKDGEHISDKVFSKQVCDRQIQFKSRKGKLSNRAESNSLVLGNSEWTPHDLRRTSATLMQKCVTRSGAKVLTDVIDLCLSHVVGSEVTRTYQLDDRFDEKKEAWELLGAKLESILSGEVEINHLPQEA